MRISRETIFFATLLLGLTGAVSVAARCTREGLAAGHGRTAPADEEVARLIAKGKGIFLEKCAKCHNERGDKELSSGKPLSERGLGTEAIARAVKGRLREYTDEERQAVTLYIASLMKGAAKGETKP